MRFPWLQVDADFIGAHAADLGAHLGISRREAMGLALDLWTWALARAREDAPPDGLVTGTGPVPDRLLSGSVGWTGPVEQLTDALVATGMAVRVEGGYRLTGFDRYKSTWEKNRRRTGGKPEGNRTGSAPVPARKTQTQTHIEDLPSVETASPAAAVAEPMASGEELPDATEHAQPLLVAVPSPPAEKPEALQSLWNAEAHPVLPRWQGMSETRKRRAVARLRERPLSAWREVIRRLSASPFCRGEEGGTGWRASPDWLLQPDVADKVLEGKYDRPGAAAAAGPPDFDARMQGLAAAVAAAKAKKSAGGGS